MAQEVVATVLQRGGRFLEKIDTMEEAQKLMVPPRTQAWRVVIPGPSLYIKVKQLMRDVGEETKAKRRQRREAQRKKLRDQKDSESSQKEEDTRPEKPTAARSAAGAVQDESQQNSDKEGSEESSESGDERKPSASTTRSAPPGSQLRRSDIAESRESASRYSAVRQVQVGDVSIPSMFRLPVGQQLARHHADLSLPPVPNLQFNQLLHQQQLPQLLQPSLVVTGAANLLHQQATALPTSQQATVTSHHFAALPQQVAALHQHVAALPSSSLRQGTMPRSLEQPAASAQQLSSDEVAALLTLVQAPAVPSRIKRDLLSLLMQNNLRR